MKCPMQITFKGLAHSDALEETARAAAEVLETRAASVVGCRLLIEAPRGNHRKGGAVHVRLDVTVPRREVVASEEVAHAPGHDDVHAAVRHVFHTVERQLSEDAHAQRKPRDRSRVSEVLAEEPKLAT